MEATQNSGAQSESTVDLVAQAIAAVQQEAAEPQQQGEKTDGQVQASPESPSQVKEQGEGEGQKDPKAEIERLLSRDREASRAKREAAQKEKKPEDPIANLRSLAQKDKMAALRELGLHPSDILTEYLATPEPVERTEPKTPPELAELKAQLAELKQVVSQTQEEKQREAQQRQRADALGQAREWLAAHKEKYEILSAAKEAGTQLLLDTLIAKYDEDRDYYQANNSAPTFEEIAEGVEAYVADQYREQLKWLAERKGLQPLLLELAQKAQSPTSQALGATRATAVPMTNQLTAESPSEAEALTEEERTQLAIKALLAQAG